MSLKSSGEVHTLLFSKKMGKAGSILNVNKAYMNTNKQERIEKARNEIKDSNSVKG